MKAFLYFTLLILVILTLAGCGRSTEPANTAARDASHLLQLDRDFSQMSMKQGAASAFNKYFAEDGIELPQNAAPIRGRGAIAAAMNAPSGKTILSWVPQDADASGDIGYTWGTYEVRSSGSDGTSKVAYGKYVTIWKRQPGGEWKAVLDMGNSSPGPAGR